MTAKISMTTKINMTAKVAQGYPCLRNMTMQGSNYTRTRFRTT